MELSALAGNRRLKEQLTAREEGRGLAHAYVISGPAGSGRHTLARLLAAAMVCTGPAGRRPCGRCAACRKAAEGIHPDVQTISGPGEGKAVTVDQIRALRADAYIRPNEGERKVYVLEQAEEMNSSAQNAMLKLLEEGPPYAAFLLLAENGGSLLQTVRSRCETLELAPAAPGECLDYLRRRFPEQPEEALRRAALDCQGLLGRAVEELTGGRAADGAAGTAARLAQMLEQGSEIQLMEQTRELEKLGREELTRLLEELETALAERAAAGGDRRRLLRAAGLVRMLREAARLNAAPGQLAGWLCAGMFLEKEKDRIQSTE